MSKVNLISKSFGLAGFLFIFTLRGVLPADEPESREPASLALHSRNVLENILDQQHGWIKVHAAEALLACGQMKIVRAAFAREKPIEKWEGTSRIGFWRVWAQCAPTARERQDSIARIENTFLTSKNPLRLNAIESFCKLNQVPAGKTLEAVRALASGPSESDATFGEWALALAGEPQAEKGLVRALQCSDPLVRFRAAYVFRWLHFKDPGALRSLATAADAEPAKTASSLIGAAVALRADPAREADWESRLKIIIATGPGNARYQACQCLMDRFTRKDLPLLAPVLDQADPDARIGAAWAILTIMGKT